MSHKDLATRRAYEKINREKILEQRRKYREINREKIRAYEQKNDPTGEKRRARRKKYRDANREKVRAEHRTYYAAHPEKRRDHQLKAKYNISFDEKTAKVLSQNNKCAICDDPIDVITGHTDHRHKPFQLRDILCKLCNPGLGNFRDNPDLLERAAAYLRRHHPTLQS